jgi:FkbM family methyltransferase
MSPSLKSILRTVLRCKPLQPVWRGLMRVSALGLRAADNSANGAAWSKCYSSSLAAMGFGTGDDALVSGEPQVLAFLKGLLPAAPTIFDVGANKGTYTQLVLALVPEATVFSFEPSPAVYQALSARFGAIPNVRLFNHGFSSTEQQTVLYSNQAGSELGSLYKRRLDHFGIDMDCQERIVLTTLDTFCSTQGVSTVDFLKLDTEGHELEVLRGAGDMLKSESIGCIQFEFGGCNIDSRTYFQDFYYCLDPQYYLYRILPSALVRVRKYREEDEVFTTTNYLGLSRRRFKELDKDIDLRGFSR